MSSPTTTQLDTQSEIMTRYIEINNNLLAGIELSYIELDQLDQSSIIIFARNNRDELVSQLIGNRESGFITPDSTPTSSIVVIDNTITKNKLKQMDKQLRDFSEDRQLIVSKADIMQFPAHIVNRAGYIFVSNEFHATECTFLFNHYLAHIIKDYNLFANTYRILQDNEFLVFKLNVTPETALTDIVYVYKVNKSDTTQPTVPSITVVEESIPVQQSLTPNCDSAIVTITADEVAILEKENEQSTQAPSATVTNDTVTNEIEPAATDVPIAESSNVSASTANRTWIEYLTSFIW
jgi:hypothetical protein